MMDTRTVFLHPTSDGGIASSEGLYRELDGTLLRKATRAQLILALAALDAAEAAEAIIRLDEGIRQCRREGDHRITHREGAAKAELFPRESRRR